MQNAARNRWRWIAWAIGLTIGPFFILVALSTVVFVGLFVFAVFFALVSHA